MFDVRPGKGGALLRRVRLLFARAGFLFVFLHRAVYLLISSRANGAAQSSRNSWAACSNARFDHTPANLNLNRACTHLAIWPRLLSFLPRRLEPCPLLKKTRKPTTKRRRKNTISSSFRRISK